MASDARRRCLKTDRNHQDRMTPPFCTLVWDHGNTPHEGMYHGRIYKWKEEDAR